jgi:DNA repair protein RadD
MQLRWYQQEAINAVHDYFEHANGNPLVLMPTGSGKSVVIGDFTAGVIQRWPSQRILMMTDSKHLIQQNADKIQAIMPNVPLGIYSAGLKKKQAIAPIVYGGVQSIYNGVKELGHRDLCLVDEAHMVDDDPKSRYGQVFAALWEKNPLMKVIGFTATGWRTRQGLLTNVNPENNYRVFTDVCYDLTKPEDFIRLIAEGYLVTPIAKPAETQINVDSVRIIGGDFVISGLKRVSDVEELTLRALRELIAHSYDRNCGMVFAVDIEHAENINRILINAFGQSSCVIHSEQEIEENDANYKAWQAGSIKWAVSVGQLAKGVDNPRIDIIGVLRTTLSSQLWVQMIGRGMRPYPGKRNLLVLDFTQNTRTLGPINDPYIPKQRGEKRTGEAPVKICRPEQGGCGCYNHTSARFCDFCGLEFAQTVKFKQEAGTEEILTGGAPQVEYFDVQYVIYNRHEKRSDPDSISLHVTYFCNGGERFDEWKTFNNKRSIKFSLDWLRQRIAMTEEMEKTITIDNILLARDRLRNPKRIRVHIKKPYSEILGYEY